MALPKRKRTKKIIAALKNMPITGKTQSQIASDFGITKGAISKLKSKHLPGSVKHIKRKRPGEMVKLLDDLAAAQKTGKSLSSIAAKHGLTQGTLSYHKKQKKLGLVKAKPRTKSTPEERQKAVQYLKTTNYFNRKTGKETNFFANPQIQAEFAKGANPVLFARKISLFRNNGLQVPIRTIITKSAAEIARIVGEKTVPFKKMELVIIAHARNFRGTGKAANTISMFYSAMEALSAHGFSYKDQCSVVDIFNEMRGTKPRMVLVNLQKVEKPVLRENNGKIIRDYYSLTTDMHNVFWVFAHPKINIAEKRALLDALKNISNTQNKLRAYGKVYKKCYGLIRAFGAEVSVQQYGKPK